MHNIEDIANKFWLTVMAALGAGLGWLIRRVFTNQRQIELLEAEVRRRGEDIKEIKEDVKELRGIKSDVKQLINEIKR